MRRSRRRIGAAVAAMAAVLLLAACGPVGSRAPDAPAGTAAPPDAVAAGAPAPVAAGAPAPLGTPADDLPAAAVVLTRPDGSEVSVAVRVAATPSDRARGLMGVAALPAGTGMLFEFPELADHGGFWMKDTLVPLDIAFAAAGEVVAVATMTPCADDPCPITHPGRPYDTALEVPAGWLAERGIRAGAGFRVTGRGVAGAPSE